MLKSTQPKTPLNLTLCMGVERNTQYLEGDCQTFGKRSPAIFCLSISPSLSPLLGLIAPPVDLKKESRLRLDNSVACYKFCVRSCVCWIWWVL